MLSDAQYQRWLRVSAPAEKTLLVALSNSAGILYLGSRPYISRPSDSLSNISFQDRLTDVPELMNAVDSSAEVGDLEFSFPGAINELMRNYWRGYKYRMWLGSANGFFGNQGMFTGSFDDFRVIASGYIENVERTSRDRMRVNFADAALALETPVVVERINVVLVPVPVIPPAPPYTPVSGGGTSAGGGYTDNHTGTSAGGGGTSFGGGVNATVTTCSYDASNEAWEGASRGEAFW